MVPSREGSSAAETVLQGGEYRAVIDHRGGHLRQLRYGSVDLLESYGAGEEPPLGANILLLPWPNRLAEGAVDAADRHPHANPTPAPVRVPITEPARGTALHGFMPGLQPERVTTGVLPAGEGEWATLSFTVGGPEDPHAEHRSWPWPLRIAAHYRLSTAGLRLTMAVTNEHPEAPAPVGAGVHTYVRLGDRPIDDCILEHNLSAELPLDPQRMLPAGPLHSGPPSPWIVRGDRIDRCFRTDPHAPTEVGLHARLLADDAGVDNPDGVTGVELSCDATLPWAQIFTADPEWELPYPGRGRALAVEPMSCPPDAFRTGIDVTWVNPKSTAEFSLGIRALFGR